ncbi:hypothetical protein YSA_01303 [Pseudomonas putida ND6]|uniref:Uncharacterized protein n=2 Tax=Pseudomonas putida TaxID=303 RepID=I3UPQ6_PSEPU|nr:hypothetical protein YSA_01303 [Pseudomonas putida ND6]
MQGKSVVTTLSLSLRFFLNLPPASVFGPVDSVKMMIL